MSEPPTGERAAAGPPGTPPQLGLSAAKRRLLESLRDGRTDSTGQAAHAGTVGQASTLTPAEAPVPAEMVGRADPAGQSVAVHPGAAVERLRDGDGPAIVLVHPVGGQILSYLELVRRLPPGPPVLGLAADQLLASEPVPSMPQLARHYLNRLTAAAAAPLVLVGWSFGGVVCYEMASQLAATGMVCPPVMLDSELIAPGGPAHQDSVILASFAYDLVRATGHHPVPADLLPASRFWRLPPSEALRLATARLASHGMPIPLPVDELLTHYRVYRAAYLALHGYRPAPYPYRVHLVQAIPGEQDLTPPWRAVAGQLRVRQIATDHYALMRTPAIDEVARLIAQVVAAAASR